MNPIKASDGVETIALTDEGCAAMLYLQTAGYSDLESVHIPEKLAFRVGMWLICYAVFSRLCGIRAWFARRSARKAVKFLPEQ